MNVSKISGPADHELDALGTMCPEPLRLATQALSEMAEGEQLLVLSDDPASPIDFEVWCLRRGHVLLSCRNTGAHWELLLQKGVPQR